MFLFNQMCNVCRNSSAQYIQFTRLKEKNFEIEREIWNQKHQNIENKVIIKLRFTSLITGTARQSDTANYMEEMLLTGLKIGSAPMP